VSLWSYQKMLTWISPEMTGTVISRTASASKDVHQVIEMTKNEIHGPPNLSVVNLDSTIRERTATAVVYCEGNFGAIDGKTANGLVRRSERYEILSVIDSEKAGLDAGTVMRFRFAAISRKLWKWPLRYLTTSYLAWRRPAACFHCTSGAWCLRPLPAE
jgi:hypothetical protein